MSGTTTITNGTLLTDDGDATHPAVTVIVPTNPAPNTTFNGIIRSVGDTFRYIFNEQVVNPDGSITVTAAHQIAIGPTAVGDLYIGKIVCGVTAVATTTTTLPATTTTLPATTTTLPATTTTIAATTTIAPGTTTTTVVDRCPQLVAARADYNRQIDAVRAAIIQSAPADQRAALLARVDASRAQGNASFDRALASCQQAP